MTAGRRRLRPTLTHTRAAHYRRPGGPWRVGTLDALLSDPLAARHHLVVDDGDDRLGGTELARAVDQLAGRLRRAGVRRGDAVAWQLPNGLAPVLLFRACWRLGAVAVPLHPATGAGELQASLAQVTPKLVVAAAGSASAELPGALTVAAPDGDPFAPLAPAPPVGRSAAASPADLALAIFTSGSTGRPRAVLHTQRGLAYKTASLARAHGLTAGDVVLAPAPMSHISGLLSGVLLPAAVGMTSVTMSRWDPERAVASIEREGVTFMAGPPTFFVTLVEAASFRPDRVSTMRLVSAGGAPVTPAFVEATAAALGCTVKRTYGSSEAPMVATSVPGDDGRRAGDADGRAVGEAELLVVDERGRRRSPGGAGELWVRGPELFVGYAEAADNEGCRARGGWFRTGDLATLDDEGWLRVVGRVKDVIIRGGENVAAAEVEGALERHPLVHQAVVVPYADAVMGERVGAAVVAPVTFDVPACGRWLARQGLARHKVPERLVHLRALPLLASGKPDRARVRALVEAAGPG